MFNVQFLIAHYGYLAIFLGTFIEGEVFLTIGGFLAHQGYLTLSFVILSAFLGTVAFDQIIFALGKNHGKKLLHKLATPDEINKIHRFIERKEWLAIFTLRFLFGLRTATILVLSTSKIKAKRFIFINVISAIVWSVCFGLLGYILGVTLEKFLGKLHNIEFQVILGIIIFSILLIVYHHLHKLKTKYKKGLTHDKLQFK